MPAGTLLHGKKYLQRGLNRIRTLLELGNTLRQRRERLSPNSPSGLLRALGWIQLQNGIASKAQEYFRQALGASKLVGDEQGRAKALHAIGEVYRTWDEYSC